MEWYFSKLAGASQNIARYLSPVCVLIALKQLAEWLPDLAIKKKMNSGVDYISYILSS